ncbi:hypothetical protein [Ewingella americana]|uniref:hypothetical protein n=1 Tax=Ewingella americana TaxID=41202 RepID=UPI00054EDF15|nr:hypothetical protein [Ewingella americana]KAA8729744.1 hypothetical protein F4W05_05940 [Ewingella americana]
MISGEFGAPKWDGCIVVGQLLAILVFNCIFKVKVKVVGSPPTLAQRVLNETLWNPAFFYCWGIEAAQGWGGRVSGISFHTAKCHRLGGAFAAGFEPWVSNLLLSAIFERGLLAFTSSGFSGVGVGSLSFLRRGLG